MSLLWKYIQIKEWIKKVKANLDPQTKLIPHSTSAKNGTTIEGARGSSMSLILRILSEIDPEFAIQQFKIFHEKFQITRFGLLFIREYPKGISGSGDIDSGPVIFNIGFTGTIVAIGTFKSYGEYKSANSLSGTIEAFGFSLSTDKKKKFIFGKLPISDAFIAWSRISRTSKEITDIKGINTFNFDSRIKFHFYSIISVFVIFIIIFRNKLMQMIKRQ